MEIQQQHSEAKEKLKREEIKRIEFSEDPFLAADLISQRDVIEACAIIDSMTPLGGAFMFLIFQMKAEKDREKYSIELIRRAENLELSAVKGLTHARNEMFRLTGQLVV